MLRLSISCGDVNGIGPEITIKTINKIYKPQARQIVYFCPANVFEKIASLIKPSFEYQVVKNQYSVSADEQKVIIVDIGKVKQNTGKPTPQAGRIAFKSIQLSFNAVKDNLADAVITAPVSKTSFDLAGIKYPGQTEIFADLCKSKNYMMVFLSNKMICGLLTIHEPIKNVPRLINRPRLTKTLKIFNDVLQRDLGIKLPRIAVLGLNPHAGENGRIGTEEVKIIKPVLSSIKRKITVDGPFVPDAFFATKQYLHYDAVLGIFHDQLLIPFKMMNFNAGVNFTAGLPIVRTSPDHGTAFDIAGKGIADESSMMEAVTWAEKIVLNRRKINALGKL